MRVACDGHVKGKVAKGRVGDLSGDALPDLEVADEVEGGVDDEKDPRRRHIGEKAGDNADVGTKVFVKANLVE